MRKITVGILALQGNFSAHEAVLTRLNVATRKIRLPQELKTN